MDVFYTGCMNMPVPLTPAGVSPARRGHKKETTCGFLLLVNLPLSLRGHGENRRTETRQGERLYCSSSVGADQCVRLFLHLHRSSCIRTATQAVQSAQARHDSAAQRFYLCRLSKSCGCSQFAPENGLRGTVILQSTLSCPSGNSPCAAPCVE